MKRSASSAVPLARSIDALLRCTISSVALTFLLLLMTSVPAAEARIRMEENVTASQTYTATPTKTYTKEWTQSESTTISVSQTTTFSQTLSNEWTKTVSANSMTFSPTLTLRLSITQTFSASESFSDVFSMSFSSSYSRTTSTSITLPSATYTASLRLSLTTSTTVSLTDELTMSGSTSQSWTPTDSTSITDEFSMSIDSQTHSSTLTMSLSSTKSATATDTIDGYSQTESFTTSASMTLSMSASDSDGILTYTISASPSLTEEFSLSESASQTLTYGSISFSSEISPSASESTSWSLTEDFSMSFSQSISSSITEIDSLTRSLSSSATVSSSETGDITMSDSISRPTLTLSALSLSPSDMYTESSSLSTSFTKEMSMSSTTSISGTLSGPTVSLSYTSEYSQSESISISKNSPSATDTISVLASDSHSISSSDEPTLTVSLTLLPSETETILKSFSVSQTATVTTPMSDSVTFSDSDEKSRTDTLTASASTSVTLSGGTPSETDDFTMSRSTTVTSTSSISASSTESASDTEIISISQSLAETTSTSISLSPDLSTSITGTSSMSGSTTQSKTLVPSDSISVSVSTSSSLSMTFTNVISASLSTSISDSLQVTLTPSSSASESDEPSRTDTVSKSISMSTSATALGTVTAPFSDTESFSLTFSKSESLSPKASYSMSISSSITSEYSLSSTGSTSLSAEPPTMSLSDSLTHFVTSTTTRSMSDETSATRSISESPSFTFSESIQLSVSTTLTMSPSNEDSQSGSLTDTGGSFSGSVSSDHSMSTTGSMSISLSVTAVQTVSIGTLTLSASTSQTVSGSPTLTWRSPSFPTQSASPETSMSMSISQSPSPSVSSSMTGETPSGSKSSSQGPSFSPDLTPSRNSLTFSFPSHSVSGSSSNSHSISISMPDTASLSHTGDLSASRSVSATPSASVSLSGPSPSFSPDSSASASLTISHSISTVPSITDSASDTRESQSVSALPSSSQLLSLSSSKFTQTQSPSLPASSTLSSIESVSNVITPSTSPTSTDSLSNEHSRSDTQSISNSPSISPSLSADVSSSRSESVSESARSKSVSGPSPSPSVTVSAPSPSSSPSNEISRSDTDSPSHSPTASTSASWTSTRSSTISFHSDTMSHSSVVSPTVSIPLSVTSAMSGSQSVSLSNELSRSVETLSASQSSSNELSASKSESVFTMSSTSSMAETETFASFTRSPSRTQHTSSLSFTNTRSVSRSVQPSDSISLSLTESFSSSSSNEVSLSSTVTVSESSSVSMPLTVSDSRETVSATHSVIDSGTSTFSASSELSLSSSQSLTESLPVSMSATVLSSLTLSASPTMTNEMTMSATQSLSIATGSWSAPLSDTRTLYETPSLSTSLSLYLSDSKTLIGSESISSSISILPTNTITETQSGSRTRTIVGSQSASNEDTLTMTLSRSVSRSGTVGSQSTSHSDEYTRSDSFSLTVTKLLFQTESVSGSLTGEFTRSESESTTLRLSATSTSSSSLTLTFSKSAVQSSSLTLTRSLDASHTQTIPISGTTSHSLSDELTATKSKLVTGTQTRTAPSTSTTISMFISDSRTAAMSNSQPLTETVSFGSATYTQRLSTTSTVTLSRTLESTITSTITLSSSKATASHSHTFSQSQTVHTFMNAIADLGSPTSFVGLRSTILVRGAPPPLSNDKLYLVPNITSGACVTRILDSRSVLLTYTPPPKPHSVNFTATVPTPGSFDVCAYFSHNDIWYTIPHPTRDLLFEPYVFADTLTALSGATVAVHPPYAMSLTVWGGTTLDTIMLMPARAYASLGCSAASSPTYTLPVSSITGTLSEFQGSVTIPGEYTVCYRGYPYTRYRLVRRSIRIVARVDSWIFASSSPFFAGNVVEGTVHGQGLSLIDKFYLTSSSTCSTSVLSRASWYQFPLSQTSPSVALQSVPIRFIVRGPISILSLCYRANFSKQATLLATTEILAMRATAVEPSNITIVSGTFLRLRFTGEGTLDASTDRAFICNSSATCCTRGIDSNSIRLPPETASSSSSETFFSLRIPPLSDTETAFSVCYLTETSVLVALQSLGTIRVVPYFHSIALTPVVLELHIPTQLPVEGYLLHSSSPTSVFVMQSDDICTVSTIAGTGPTDVNVTYNATANPPYVQLIPSSIKGFKVCLVYSDGIAVVTSSQISMESSAPNEFGPAEFLANVSTNVTFFQTATRHRMAASEPTFSFQSRNDRMSICPGTALSSGIIERAINDSTVQVRFPQSGRSASVFCFIGSGGTQTVALSKTVFVAPNLRSFAFELSAGGTTTQKTVTKVGGASSVVLLVGAGISGDDQVVLCEPSSSTPSSEYTLQTFSSSTLWNSTMDRYWTVTSRFNLSSSRSGEHQVCIRYKDTTEYLPLQGLVLVVDTTVTSIHLPRLVVISSLPQALTISATSGDATAWIRKVSMVPSSDVQCLLASSTGLALTTDSPPLRQSTTNWAVPAATRITRGNYTFCYLTTSNLVWYHVDVFVSALAVATSMEIVPSLATQTLLYADCSLKVSVHGLQIDAARDRFFYCPSSESITSCSRTNFTSLQEVQSSSDNTTLVYTIKESRIQMFSVFALIQHDPAPRQLGVFDVVNPVIIQGSSVRTACVITSPTNTYQLLFRPIAASGAGGGTSGGKPEWIAADVASGNSTQTLPADPLFPFEVLLQVLSSNGTVVSENKFESTPEVTTSKKVQFCSTLPGTVKSFKDGSSTKKAFSEGSIVLQNYVTSACPVNSPTTSGAIEGVLKDMATIVTTSPGIVKDPKYTIGVMTEVTMSAFPDGSKAKEDAIIALLDVSNPTNFEGVDNESLVASEIEVIGDIVGYIGGHSFDGTDGVADPKVGLKALSRLERTSQMVCTTPMIQETFSSESLTITRVTNGVPVQLTSALSITVTVDLLPTASSAECINVVFMAFNVLPQIDMTVPQRRRRLQQLLQASGFATDAPLSKLLIFDLPVVVLFVPNTVRNGTFEMEVALAEKRNSFIPYRYYPADDTNPFNSVGEWKVDQSVDSRFSGDGLALRAESPLVGTGKLFMLSGVTRNVPPPPKDKLSLRVPIYSIAGFVLLIQIVCSSIGFITDKRHKKEVAAVKNDGDRAQQLQRQGPKICLPWFYHHSVFHCIAIKKEEALGVINGVWTSTRVNALVAHLFVIALFTGCALRASYMDQFPSATRDKSLPLVMLPVAICVVLISSPWAMIIRVLLLRRYDDKASVIASPIGMITFAIALSVSHNFFVTSIVTGVLTLLAFFLAHAALRKSWSALPAVYSSKVATVVGWILLIAGIEFAALLLELLHPLMTNRQIILGDDPYVDDRNEASSWAIVWTLFGMALAIDLLAVDCAKAFALAALAKYGSCVQPFKVPKPPRSREPIDGGEDGDDENYNLPARYSARGVDGAAGMAVKVLPYDDDSFDDDVEVISIGGERAPAFDSLFQPIEEVSRGIDEFDEVADDFNDSTFESVRDGESIVDFDGTEYAPRTAQSVTTTNNSSYYANAPPTRRDNGAQKSLPHV